MKPEVLRSWSLEVDYSRAPCLGADQKARGLWERDCHSSRRNPPALQAILKTELSDSYSFYNNHVISLPESSSNTNPKWSVLVVFSNSSGVEWVGPGTKLSRIISRNRLDVNKSTDYFCKESERIVLVAAFFCFIPFRWFVVSPPKPSIVPSL